MKFSIEVELFSGERPVTPKDLRFGSANFLKAAPKALKRAIKAACWAFDPVISVHLVEDEKKERKRATRTNLKGGGKKRQSRRD